ncbi:MAG: hypothetical protein JW927_01645 [Deltaproteobacteria bacterium]|nr:hypothetical protein [Deltaproteobacteria bacterium]
MKKILHTISNSGQGILYLILLTIVFAASAPSEASVMDFSDYNLAGSDLVTKYDSNFIHSGNVVGTLTSTVYKKDSVYTYVLEVTPSFDLQIVTGFDMVLEPGEASKAGGYTGILGFDFDEAINAFGLGDGSGMFSPAIGDGNTVKWDAAWGTWLTGKSITFFYEHSGAPVMGAYQIIAEGYVPGATPVPIPSAIMLLGPCLIGFTAIKKRMNSI